MRWLPLLVVSAALGACGFPRPDRVAGDGDGGERDAPLAPGKLATFGFTKATNPELFHDIHARFVGPDNLALTAVGFQLGRAALVATFTTSAGTERVEVDGVVQASGFTSHDFRDAVTYTVFATDGSRTAYTVHVASRVLSASVLLAEVGFKDVALGDVDGDGRADLATVGVTGDSVQVYINATPQGSTNPMFAARRIFASGINSPSRILLADLNGDHQPELVVSSDNSSKTVGILRNLGPTGFSPATTYNTFGNPDVQALAAGDLNRDGLVDLVSCEHNSDQVHAAFNTTMGADPTMITFGPPAIANASSLPIDMQLADFNNDQQLDLVVANENAATVSLFRGATPSMGVPKFGAGETTDVPASPFRLAVVDFDRDGDPDVLVASKLSSAFSVLVNTSGVLMAPFSFTTDSPPVALAVLDLDDDGYVDVVVNSSMSTSSSGPLQPFINVGDGTPGFLTASPLAAPTGVTAASAADLNGDGITDFVIANNSGVYVYLVGDVP
ncbi:hypothetical protein BH11MYX1_BH11MYX1_41380 [soil metagenome]